MKNKPKLLVITGLLTIVLFGAGIYINHQLSQLSNLSGLSLLDPNSGETDYSKTGSSTSSEGKIESIEGYENLETGSSKVSQNTSKVTSQVQNKNLVSHVQEKIGRPIAKKDILTAGIIIMRKLNAEDISYLSKVAMKDSYSQEDYRRAREILANKLSADDINTLNKLCGKYGSKITIPNQNK